MDNEESDYLGNVFENEDDVDFAGENISGSDSDPDNEIDMELNYNTPSVAAAIEDPTPALKQIFSDLEKVLNLDNYDPRPVQEYSKFEYSNSSRSSQVDWKQFERIISAILAGFEKETFCKTSQVQEMLRVLSLTLWNLLVCSYPIL